jgi:hypothetical protein
MCVETSIRTRYSRGPDVRVAVNARRLTAGSRDRLNVSKDERRALAARVVGRAVTTANERKVMAAQRSKKKGSSRARASRQYRLALRPRVRRSARRRHRVAAVRNRPRERTGLRDHRRPPARELVQHVAPEPQTEPIGDDLSLDRAGDASRSAAADRGARTALREHRRSQVHDWRSNGVPG